MASLSLGSNKDAPLAPDASAVSMPAQLALHHAGGASKSPGNKRGPGKAKRGKHKLGAARSPPVPFEELPKEVQAFLQARQLGCPAWLTVEVVHSLKGQFNGFGIKQLEAYGISSMDEFLEAWYRRNRDREAMLVHMTSPDVRGKERQAARAEYIHSW